MIGQAVQTAGPFVCILKNAGLNMWEITVFSDTDNSGVQNVPLF